MIRNTNHTIFSFTLKFLSHLRFSFLLLGVLYFLPTVSMSQGNGDPLGFQGLSKLNMFSAQALAQGNTSIAQTGVVNSLFNNPAGLGDIERLQISISGKSSQWKQHENQYWTESRLHPLLPAILDGRYVPNPHHNGLLDTALVNLMSPDDYTIPLLGFDQYSPEVADWKDSYISQSPVNNISLAIPLKIMGKSLVLAAGLARRNDIYEYDRNDTYLNPHFGDRTNPVILAAPDSMIMNWFKYERLSKGGINALTFGLALRMSNHLQLGLSIQNLNGESDDHLEMDKVGYFLFPKSDEFAFTYDTMTVVQSGKSTFGTTSDIRGMPLLISFFNPIKFGILFNYKQFDLGFCITSPYTITRDWDYTIEFFETDTITTTNINGQDQMDLPITIALGAKIEQKNRLSISFDIGFNPYSQTHFSYTDTSFNHTIFQLDTLRSNWVDQTTFGIGMKYGITPGISVMAGYRSVPEVFIPNRAAFRHKGPEMESVSAGISVAFPFGQIDLGYEYRFLKYYDSWESNLNYVLKTENHLGVSLRFGL